LLHPKPDAEDEVPSAPEEKEPHRKEEEPHLGGSFG
jgi:hypothetical protein